MEHNEKIVDRIRKLLTMADKGTVHEKEIALYQAQRLMAKYRIEEYQIWNHWSEVVVELLCAINIRKVIWQCLHSVIAKNFRCKAVNRIISNTIKYPVFVGLEMDAEVAVEVFKSAYEFAHAEAHRIAAYHSYHYGSAKGVRDEWISGFIKGLDEGFRAQIAMSDETAIMIIIPQEVNDYHSQMDFLKPEDIPDNLQIRRNGQKELFDSGFNHGYEFAHKRKQDALE